MAIADIAARPRLDPLSKRLRLLVLLGLLMPVAVVLASVEAPSPLSCKYHPGPFDNSFSVQFDISRVDCRSAWLKDSPTIHLWGVPPYVGIEWPK